MQAFRINISNEEIANLQERLRNTRAPNVLNTHAWDNGASLDFMTNLLEYWCTKFDWRTAESRLNQLPQFKTEINGVDLHFIHVKTSAERKIPIILSHGWPGSFIEMQKIIPMLTSPSAYGLQSDFAFDVVVPSLPGFGFSTPFKDPDQNTVDIADMWAHLMKQLGYSNYGVQGGDIGAGISMALGYKYPNEVRGIHVNYIPGSYQPPINSNTPAISDSEKDYLKTVSEWSNLEGAYIKMHSTKPLTLGYSLQDSPAGLAAWIIEKFQSWSDCDGDLKTAIDIDTVLTNISIYWFSKNVTSTLQLYKANTKNSIFKFKEGERVAPRLGVAHFPKELPTPPRSWVERCFNVSHWSEMPKGGHFAALEQPYLLAEDIFRFFQAK